MTYIFLQFYYIIMFEVRYLMKRLLLHVLFSHFLCYLDISFFLSIMLLQFFIQIAKYILAHLQNISQFLYVARKIAVTLRQISFSVCQRVGIV